MATPAFVEQDASHSAALFRQMLASLWGATQPGTLVSPASGQVGVAGDSSTAVGGVVNKTDLLVTANTTPNMSVNVAGGSALIPQTQAANAGLYFAFFTAKKNYSLAAASAVNPRVDGVFGSVLDKAYSGSTTERIIQVVTGTPTAGATLTNLSGAPAVPAASIPLAWVLVTANATSISSAKIKDARPFAAMGNPLRGVPVCRVYYNGSGPAAIGAQTPMPFNTVVYDTASGWSGTTHLYRVPVPGYYRVSTTLTVATLTAGHQLQSSVYRTGGEVATGTPSNASANFWPTSTASDLVRCAAGDTLQGWYFATNNDAFKGDAQHCFMTIALESQ